MPLKTREKVPGQDEPRPWYFMTTRERIRSLGNMLTFCLLGGGTGIQLGEALGSVPVTGLVFTVQAVVVVLGWTVFYRWVQSDTDALIPILIKRRAYWYKTGQNPAKRGVDLPDDPFQST